MDKQKVADILNEIALYLELKGENPLRFVLMKMVCKIVQALMRTSALIKENRLGTIKGIGQNSGTEDN